MIFQNLIKKYTVFIIAVWIVIVVSIFAFFHSKADSTAQIPFDSNKWKTMEKIERYTMYDDLVNNYNIIGMNCSEVEQLLGEKSISYDPNEDASDNDYYWGYTIRRDNFEGDEVLLIHFENNTVSEVEKEYLEYL